MNPRDIVVCSSERTGSTLLCELLRDAGVIAFGHEIFEDRYVMQEVVLGELPGWTTERAREDPRRYLDAVRARWSDPTRSFAVKIHWFSYEKWRPLGFDILPFFDRPRFIFCTRGNVVLQAISSVRAQQTGSWYWSRPPRQTPSYDFMAIRERVEHLTRENTQWEEYFRAHGIAPFRSVYETLDHDFRAVMRHLLRWIGDDAGDASLEALQPRMKRQRDDTSYDWLRRYWSDLGAAT